MSYLNALLSDLRDRKLWPVAVVLLAAIVAVPVLLSKSPAPAPAPSGSAIGTPVAEAHTGAAITVQDAAVQAPLSGSGRDPFTQQKLSSPTTTTTASSATTTVVAGSASASAGTGGGSASTASAGSSSSTGSTVSPVLPVNPTSPSSTPTSSTPAPPAGLSADQAYDVAVSITNAAGGLNTIDPFVRDGVLPSHKQPLLVQLGVLQGGHRVLFAVQPGAIVNGPGSCTPGPLDCQILGLSPGQTEGISVVATVGGQALTQSVALFQVTAISAVRYASAAAADRARAATDALGRRLLGTSTASALSLFQYEPSLDAIVDQRNLTVGGN